MLTGTGTTRVRALALVAPALALLISLSGCRTWHTACPLSERPRRAPEPVRCARCGGVHSKPAESKPAAASKPEVPKSKPSGTPLGHAY